MYLLASDDERFFSRVQRSEARIENRCDLAGCNDLLIMPCNLSIAIEDGSQQVTDPRHLKTHAIGMKKQWPSRGTRLDRK